MTAFNSFNNNTSVTNNNNPLREKEMPLTNINSWVYSCDEQLGLGIKVIMLSFSRELVSQPVVSNGWSSSWVAGSVLQPAGILGTEWWQKTESDDTDFVDNWSKATWLLLTGWVSGTDGNWKLCGKSGTTLLGKNCEVFSVVRVHDPANFELSKLHGKLSEQMGMLLLKETAHNDDVTALHCGVASALVTQDGGNDTDCRTCILAPVRFSLFGIVRWTSCPLFILINAILPNDCKSWKVADVCGTNWVVFDVDVLTTGLSAVTEIRKPLGSTKAEDCRVECRSSELCEVEATGNLWSETETCCSAATLVVCVQNVGSALVTDKGPGVVTSMKDEVPHSGIAESPLHDTGSDNTLSAKSVICWFKFCTGKGNTTDTAGDVEGIDEAADISWEFLITGSVDASACSSVAQSRPLSSSLVSSESSNLISCTADCLSFCNLMRFFRKLSSRLQTRYGKST